MTSPVLASIYNVALRTDRRTAWTAAAVSAAVLVGADAVWTSDSWLDPDKAAMVAWTALPAAVGDGLRLTARLTSRPWRKERSTPSAPASKKHSSEWRPNAFGSHANCTTSSRTTSP